MLGFKLLLPFLNLKRRQFKEGKSGWNPPLKWSVLFKDYFSGSAEEMTKKLKKNPEGCFDFIDEGVDIGSWQHMLENEQKDLIEMILKAGKRKHLTILITPSMTLMRKDILTNAHYLFMLIDEPDEHGNAAYLFKNYKNPILREKMPFGFKKIEDDVMKQQFLANPDAFDRYLQHRTTFITKCRYKNINPKLYALYDKLVKEPLIMKAKSKARMVTAAKHVKLQYALDTLLYNLHERDGKSMSQIANLLIDKFGTPVISAATIRPHVERITAMTEKPEMEEEELIEKPQSEEDSQQIEKLEAEFEAEEQADKSKNEADANQDKVG